MHACIMLTTHADTLRDYLLTNQCCFTCNNQQVEMQPRNCARVHTSTMPGQHAVQAVPFCARTAYGSCVCD
jgi:hypothetical protein